ncbi:phosphate propanoyltransferase [candidate division LCP-89 bacterium B3_LCP]|uniref:Phosphate propanoyltransferase n=1 Tax=candidate division LCP-89 bacterium B3_LCP TaxID=2012998 RepID=A0A532UTZ5_UNCL8|nr:MAG: phosphate propanoyltransferase [candidate division LCP-89 bacterium B3_LCP]
MPVKKPISVGISPRHIHLSKEDFHRLFGPDATLTRTRDLTQKGQFASEQFVTLATSVGRIENVRVLGPFRDASQVELSATDAVGLGLNPPVRDSGDHEGSPGITITGPSGRVDIPEGVILAQRHVHMTPKDAREYNVVDKEIVFMALSAPTPNSMRSAPRTVIFGDVLIRISENYRLDFHLDTDEANASGARTGDSSVLFKIGGAPLDDNRQYYPEKRLYSEFDVRKARQEGMIILIEKDTILTPSALDLGREKGLFEFR